MVGHLGFCMARRPRNLPFVLVGVVLAGLAAGFAGCQHQPLTTSQSGSLQAGAVPELEPAVHLAAMEAADFEIVDCLLPGRIHRFGTRLIYSGARHPIRTTGRDCAIRGGEYVAYDRANYATALEIWLPLAEGGDPNAQTYVGDIYEKGLGGTPDYALAATWYQRAVKQGHAAAQVSLGQLYERGLGVQQDMVAALNLYRRASGLEEKFDLVFAPQVRALQGEVAQSNRTAERLGQQVASLQRELDQARHQLEGLREQAETERRSLELERRQLTERGDALDAGPSRAERDVAERDEQATRARQIEEQQAELEKLRGVLAKREAELARRTEELERRGLETTARATELQEQAASERESIDLAQRELAEQRAELDARFRRLELQREGTADQRTTHARQVEEQRAELQQQHAMLEEREVELARRTEELERRLTDIERQEVALEQKQDEIAQLDQEAPQPGLAPAEDLIDFGTYYALVIGNDQYASYRGVSPLKSPQADARAISALLKQKYGYVVTTLINAKRDQILGALNTLRENLQDEDNLLIYYAGHGTLDEENERGHWLPVDAEPYPQTTNWISSTEITDILNSMRAKHVLVIADSCYAGSLTANSQSMGLGVPQEERYFWLKTIVNKPARMALTSGNLSPVLDGGGGQHSIFARALLEVLGTNSEVLEGWRVYLRVSAHVSDVARVYGMKQVPTYGAIKSEKYGGGDFLFVRS